jgi:catechol 2,3-dioxygenase-like lactoylglutathione lyase family enzyme
VKIVLADAMVVSTVAVTDLDRARRFFQEQLGLPLLDETPFAFRFGAGRGTQMSVRRGQPNVGQTAAHFEVDDIEAVIRDLTSRGITFEEYDTPKTTNFIAQIGQARGAWFNDQMGTCSACARDRFPARHRVAAPPEFMRTNAPPLTLSGGARRYD